MEKIKTYLSDPDSYRIDSLTVHAGLVYIREMDEAIDGLLTPELKNAVIANAQNQQNDNITVVQFERINPNGNYVDSLAFRPGIGYKAHKDVSIKGPYYPLNETGMYGVGPKDETSVGRWIPIETLGELISDQTL